MKAYACGFAFDGSENLVFPTLSVALIRKVRPDWQKGFLNGIGGHIEDGETSQKAMAREFEEETGLAVPFWEFFVTLEGGDWFCDFYRAFDVDLSMVKTMTDEHVVVMPVRPLPPDVVPNLHWLVPLALDTQPTYGHVRYD